jgi:bifunctional diaminopimelate decarboxylase / aspartate kinase
MSVSPWVVLKFGGTSVANHARWQTISDQAAARVADGLRPVLVCSAVSGVSDLLSSLPEHALAGTHRPVVATLRARHAALAADLGIDLPAEAASILDQLGSIAEGIALVEEVGPKVRARILSAGELLSTRIGAAFLSAQGLDTRWADARTLLEATPDEDRPETRRYLDATCIPGRNAAVSEALVALGGTVVLTQGFIARRPDTGATCLLGRGGSDTSAALLAAALGARRCEIWTDVPGLFTANPRQVPSARLLRSLDFAEAQEIASTGAKVLHPRCVPPLRDAGIPLHVRCTPDPSLPSTVIGPTPAEPGPSVKAVSSRHGVTLVTMETVGMWQQVGFLADAFACFKAESLSIDLVATSETSVTVSLDPAAAPLDDASAERLLARLRPLCEPRIVRGCAAVSLVGRRIRSMLHRLSGVFELFEEQRVHLLSQAASDLNLTVVVDAGQAERLVEKIHARLLQEVDGSAALGPAWSTLTAPAAATAPAQRTPWWRTRAPELLALGRRTSPAYVYDAGVVQAAARGLTGLETPARILYAMKANPNRELMALIRDEGLGFECVSVPEVARAVDVLAETGSDAPVLFTPNFAAREEYAEGFELGARVTLDNLHPLAHWPEVFADRDVFVRVDPGHGHGHHAHVRTGGTRSKFGVSLDQMPELAALAAAAGCRVVGLHAHVGSGVRDAHAWTDTARFLAQVAADFPDVRVLDLGGGLGVPEKPGQTPLDLRALDAALAAVQAEHPALDIWLEPGRYLVAEAGVLLTTVTQLKTKGPQRYVGVDAGMNTLIRPALYGAWHEIVNLSRSDTDAPLVEADVVGPICETGDVLGHGRRLPDPQEGDVLIVGTAGAYGRAMSSRYNLREPAVEVVLPATP